MPEGELFTPPADHLPLAARMAPAALEEFVGQEHLLAPGKMLRRLIESDRVTSALFFGTPGSGKTALARFIASKANARFEELNAVLAGVAELKKTLESAKHLAAHTGRRTLLLVDEIHHFNRTQQDVLLPSVERGEVILIGMTTENPSFYVNAALLSRFTSFEFHPLTEDHLKAILDRAASNPERGLGAQQLAVEPDARDHFARMAGGDARKLLNALELSALTTPVGMDGKRRITLAVAEESIQRRSLRYDRKSDDHYDHISAFIKSMRGSDPDAAVYWMAKMLAAGEDPRFLARRIVICASEDVGNADFRALVVANAAFQAVEFVGMPEARIPLSQAAIYVACAPKSNAAYLAIDNATSEVHSGPAREVPLHLRDANMDSKSRGHGVGYKYPHDFPGHYVDQEYLPKPVKLYEPTDQGDEARLADRLKSLKSGKSKR
ncbi:MAG: replication-associated recombination protein A [Elusimicrobia bacterium]|nr:replication-associated recombination protein A [Elusimicrobiota bacterium]